MAYVPEDLTGTIVILTGGTRGLGRSMTFALLEAGASVVVMARDQDRLDELQSSATGTLLTLQGDVAKESDLEKLVDRTRDAFGRIDVVVSNAGISVSALREDWPDDPLPFWMVGTADYERSFAINTLAPFLIAQMTVPKLIEQGWGRLVYTSTSLGTMLRRGQTGYGPSKAASEAFATIIAQDLEGTGVTSNVILPGGPADIDTISAAIRNSGRKLIPPEMMGPPIVWLASRASDGVTGMRYIAKLWDSNLPAHEAAVAAGVPAAWSGVLSDADKPAGKP